MAFFVAMTQPEMAPTTPPMAAPIPGAAEPHMAPSAAPAAAPLAAPTAIAAHGLDDPPNSPEIIEAAAVKAATIFCAVFWDCVPTAS